MRMLCCAWCPSRDWYLIAEQPAPAPHLAHPTGCAALCIVLVTVPRVSRSCQHFPFGLDLHLLRLEPRFGSQGRAAAPDASKEGRRWRSNPSGKCSQERLTRGTVTSTMRRAAHPSGCAGAGCSAIKYRSLQSAPKPSSSRTVKQSVSLGLTVRPFSS